MYFLTMFFLSIVTILLLYYFSDKLKLKMLLWIVPVCSLFAWIEFVYMNNADIMEAWVFNDAHILGFRVFNTVLEDFIFAPVMAIILFLIYEFMDKRINSKSSSPVNKGLHIILFASITLFFTMFGGEFSKYQAVKMIVGLIGVLISFKTWDVKQFYAILGVYVIISGGWDIWSGNCTIQQWFYRYENLQHSKVYADWTWWWFRIGKAWFPLSVFPYYYISGSIFFQGVALITNKFLNYRR